MYFRFCYNSRIIRGRPTDKLTDVPLTCVLLTILQLCTGGEFPPLEKYRFGFFDILLMYQLQFFCTRTSTPPSFLLSLILVAVGLHTLVPESLLTLWDEEDLELLLCGIRQTTIDPPHPPPQQCCGSGMFIPDPDLQHCPPDLILLPVPLKAMIDLESPLTTALSLIRGVHIAARYEIDMVGYIARLS
jgi:hypothetical protein